MKVVKTSTISKNYAKALLDIYIESNKTIDISEQLTTISETLSNSTDLQIVISNSAISISKKIEIIDEIFQSSLDKKVLNFIKILIEKQRINEFEAIKKEFEDMVSVLSNKKTVVITSPIKLNFENRTNVLFKLEKKLNCEVQPIWEIDESLIAGLTFKIGDCVIDTSLRTKLENLSKNITR